MKYGGTVYPSTPEASVPLEMSKVFAMTSHSPATGHYENPTVSQVGQFEAFDLVSRRLSSGVNPSDLLPSQSRVK